MLEVTILAVQTIFLGATAWLYGGRLVRLERASEELGKHIVGLERRFDSKSPGGDAGAPAGTLSALGASSLFSNLPASSSGLSVRPVATGVADRVHQLETFVATRLKELWDHGGETTQHVQDALRAFEASAASLGSRVEQCWAAVAAVKASDQDTKTRISDVVREVQLLRDTVSTCSASVSDLRHDVEGVTVHSEAALSSSDLVEVTAKIDRLKAEAMELKTSLDRAAAQVADIGASVGVALKQILQETADRSAADAQIKSELGRAVDVLASTVNSSAQHQAGLQSALDQVAAGVRGLQAAATSNAP